MTALTPNNYQLLASIVGSEPPMESGSVPHSPEDWHRISLRWLSGTVIAGLFGAALIGAAVYTSLDRQAHFAEMPVLVPSTHREQPVVGKKEIRKGDRLVRPVDIVAAKQSYRVTIPVKIGDKEVLMPRMFTKVSTPLTLTPTVFAEDVPKFDPLRLLTGTKDTLDSQLDQAPIIDAAEVSLATRDLSGGESFASNAQLSLDEARAQVTEQLRNAADGAKAAFNIPPQLLLMHTSRADAALNPNGLAAPGLDATAPGGISDTAFSSIKVQWVPENVTTLPRQDAQPNVSQMEERLAIVHKGETLEDILRANKADSSDISAVMTAVSNRGGAVIHEGQRVKLLFADINGDATMLNLARVSIYTDETLESEFARADAGQFMPVHIEQAPSSVEGQQQDQTADEDTDAGGIRLYNALYETALKQEMPKPIIDDMTVIFSNSVDFQKAAAAGDSFEALYTGGEENEGKPELLYASITAHNETYRFYRFQSPDDNSVDYYDEKGKSSRKFLIRKPIAFGVERSGFGMRRHPIFGYMRLHTGVDWAAPTGTPIFAAGNGVIVKAGWTSGYGRRVEIEHQGGYETTYNHMSGFGRGISEGAHVKQGQIVGYVGTTGNVTGAHLHYEVMINGRFVDPLGIRLPRTRELSGKLLTAFKQNEQRIDDIISKAPNAEMQARIH